MNLPYMPGVRRVSPAGLPCDPGRVESGVRKRFRFIALLTLAVFMAGGDCGVRRDDCQPYGLSRRRLFPLVSGPPTALDRAEAHRASGHGAESRRHAARRPLLLS